MEKYEKNIASKIKANPKLLWNYVNSKTKSRQPVSDLKKTNGDMTANDEEKAQVLNEFFSSVFTKENLKEIPEAAKRNHIN